MSDLPGKNTVSQSKWWQAPVINRRAWDWEGTHNHHKGRWWQHAVIYQIFPLTFYDSDDDGIGDLNGIITKLDYIRSLGIEAIWLNPIYPSKHQDAGYAITDMDEIDPLFGDLKIFQQLIDLTHNYGMKIIIDQVWSHTADTHPWFLESASSRDNLFSDWYVWADAKPDGAPPNNWLSAFTGTSAWHWHEGRQQYYLANFMPSQPDLNWHNDQVIDALMASARHWLERGVDGFRIDAVNFFVHDAELKDNPPRTAKDKLPDGIDPANPLTRQRFVNNFCRPETIEKLHKIRQLLDEYPDTVSLGELTLAEDSIALSGEYVAGDQRLHLIYNSALLREEPLSTAMLHEILQQTQTHFPDGGQCWMLGNHDYQRFRSRWTGADADGNPYPPAFYKMAAALVIALPGALCLYQGDELGLPLARIPEDIAEAQLRDPYGKCEYPRIVGRDGSRTPMPWLSEHKNLGFTAADEPWLPTPPYHNEFAVDKQTRDPSSLLSAWRTLLQWRVAQPALIAGDYATLAAHDHIFAFKRTYAEQTLYCLFNISAQAQVYALGLNNPPSTADKFSLLCLNGNDISINPNGEVQLQPYAAVFISVLEGQDQ